MPVKAAQTILSDEAEAARAALAASNAKEATSIRKRIDSYLRRLVADCQAGEVIRFPLRKTAKRLERRHGPLHNLYCVDLPAFWRMLYTIVRVDGTPYVYILEIVDHTAYSNWFPGRKKQ